MERKIKEKVTGFRTKDGAGVSLVRVLGHDTVETFDPILMLDSFDSERPDDYTAGFPLHPHRGIETISLIVSGNMVHRDSLGNEDAISDGEVQWMTAGSGIMHEEKLPASERLLGVQLWLNMPRENKMAPPEYHSIKKEDIEEIPLDGGLLRLISGKYKDHEGFRGKYLPVDYYDIKLEPGKSFTIETGREKSVLVFTLSGAARIAGEKVEEKTKPLYSDYISEEVFILGQDIHIPKCIRSYYRGIDDLPPEIRKAFRNAARLYNKSSILGMDESSFQISLLVASVETLAKQEMLSYSDFVKKYNPNAKKSDIDDMYEIRSKLFHSGEFSFFEYDVNMNPYVNPVYEYFADKYTEFRRILRKTIINWIKINITEKKSE